MCNFWTQKAVRIVDKYNLVTYCKYTIVVMTFTLAVLDYVAQTGPNCYRKGRSYQDDVLETRRFIIQTKNCDDVLNLWFQIWYYHDCQLKKSIFLYRNSQRIINWKRREYFLQWMELTQCREGSNVTKLVKLWSFKPIIYSLHSSKKLERVTDLLT